MNRRQEKAALRKALTALSGFHWSAARILYSVNGFDSAMEYARAVHDKAARDNAVRVRNDWEQLELL